MQGDGARDQKIICASFTTWKEIPPLSLCNQSEANKCSILIFLAKLRNMQDIRRFG